MAFLAAYFPFSRFYFYLLPKAAGVAERSNGKRRHHQSKRQSDSENPQIRAALPVAPGGSASERGEKQEKSAGDFVKQLANHAPNGTEERRQRGQHRSHQTIRHANILAEWPGRLACRSPEARRARRRAGHRAEFGTCMARERVIEWDRIASRRMAVQLDDQMKQLLRDLGHAINETVSDSERIAEAISNVRAAGFDIVLKLDATIVLAKRDAEPSKLTKQDQNFLESLHIRVDEEILDDESAEMPKVQMTAQDIKFLKSLKISLDEKL